MSHHTDALAPAHRGRNGRGGRAVLIVVAILAVLAAVLTGGAYAYAKQYDGKALPGTTVLGQDVSGRSEAEIASLVTDRAEKVVVTVTSEGQSHEVSLADLGVAVDAEGTAKKAVAHEGGIGDVARSTFSGERVVKPSVSVDAAAVTAFADSLVPEDQTRAVDAQLVRDEESGEWTVIPGHAGKAADSDALLSAVQEHAPDLESFSVDQPITEQQPKLTDEAANTALEDIRAKLDQAIVVTGPNDARHEASEQTIGSWIVAGPDEAGTAFAVTIDPTKVHDWVAGRAEKDTVKPTDGIEQVDAAGTTIKTLTEKKDGVEITNTDAVAQQITDNLTANSPAELAFTTQPVPAKVTKAKAPDAAQTDKQDPNATDGGQPTGEKWIDINLSDKTLTAYVGDTPVFGPRKIVDGKQDYETVTGTYHIYQRYDSQDMTNEGKVDKNDPRYYYTEDVPWVQYFYGGYAIHGAPWRSSFGFSGSHGCVNMSVSDAKWIYDWSSVGTKVVVHY